MLAAARLVGTRRFIAQSFCGWPFAREGGPVKTEEDPLDPNPPASFSKTLAAIRYLENTVQSSVDVQALALRYGILYGPGTGIAQDGAIVELVRKRRMLIVGDGGVSMITKIRGGSNAKAKRAFGWQPIYPSWRRGFVEGLG